MFDKYARAIADPQERKRIYGLYVARNACLAATFTCVCALVLACLIADTPIRTWQQCLVCVVLAATFVSAVASVVTWAYFAAAFRRVLARKSTEGESKDETAYRAQAVRARKSTRWALWVMIGCIVAMVVCIAVDAYREEGDSFGIFAYIGIGIAVIGVLVYFAAAFAFAAKNGDAAQDKPNVQAIDARQGRQGKYRVEEDPAAGSYRYIFPDPDLRARAEPIKRAYGKALTMSILGGLFAAMLLIFVVFSDVIFSFGLRGYAAAVLQGIVFVLALAVPLPSRRKLLALEREQRAAIADDERYAVHREMYRRYDGFSRTYARALMLFVLVNFAAALLLGILFPAKLWSMLTFVSLLVAVWIYNRGFRALRLSLIPLEKQIDAMQAAETVQAQAQAAQEQETEQTTQEKEQAAETAQAQAQDTEEQTADADERIPPRAQEKESSTAEAEHNDAQDIPRGQD